MSNRHFGRGTYRAFRSGGFLHIIAIGETPNFNDEVILEQLPFLIFPPEFGLFFLTQDVSLPASKPFTIEKRTIFPSAPSVTIQDADGSHSVAISELGDLPAAPARAPEIAGNDFCVFQWIGIRPYLIAKCDAVVPAVYSRVFGPDTHAKCEEYVRSHGGLGGLL
jgi:hypothetical protein